MAWYDENNDAQTLDIDDYDYEDSPFLDYCVGQLYFGDADASSLPLRPFAGSSGDETVAAVRGCAGPANDSDVVDEGGSKGDKVVDEGSSKGDKVVDEGSSKGSSKGDKDKVVDEGSSKGDKVVDEGRSKRTREQWLKRFEKGPDDRPLKRRKAE
jgi:hypothetical protein